MPAEHVQPHLQEPKRRRLRVALVVLTPGASADWGEAMVGRRAPTALADLVEQASGVAAASVLGEPAATFIPDALPAMTTSICSLTTATVNCAVPH